MTLILARKSRSSDIKGESKTPEDREVKNSLGFAD